VIEDIERPFKPLRRDRLPIKVMQLGLHYAFIVCLVFGPSVIEQRSARTGQPQIWSCFCSRKHLHKTPALMVKNAAWLGEKAHSVKPFYGAKIRSSIIAALYSGSALLLESR
jgi:hypothetical protein